MEEPAATALHDLETAHGALHYLRDNRLDRALEALETGLEVSIIHLNALLDQARPSDREMILRALVRVRDYRKEHPRRTEVDTSRWDEKLVTVARELQKKAGNILDELK